MDLPGAFQTSASGLLLTVPLSAPPDPRVAQQVQTSQPGLEIGTSIYLSGLVLSDIDKQTLLDYVGSLIRDSMKKCDSAFWEEILRAETCLFLTA